MEIRHPIVAGTFYPDDSELLEKMIHGFLDNATVEKHRSPVKAIIVPHAGYVYSGPVAAYAFKSIEDYSYKKIILLGPSHHFSFDNLVSCGKEYCNACGKIPIEVLLNIVNIKQWNHKLLCSMNSGEISGDKSQVVGYASIAY